MYYVFAVYEATLQQEDTSFKSINRHSMLLISLQETSFKKYIYIYTHVQGHLKPQRMVL